MSSIFQDFFNVKFCDVYNDEASFIDDYNGIGLPALIKEENARTIYYLLYARYGNSTIACSDLFQFKYKLFSIIWQYGATWEKRLEIQAKLRSLSLDEGSDIYKGNKAIYNNALNPETNPTTGSLDELTYINSQNTTNYKKGILEGLTFLSESLEDDVSNEFLKKFEKLFIKIIAGDTRYYATKEEDDTYDI